MPTLLNLSNIVHIACGTNHALAITGDGKVYSWGVGEQGQLGRKIVSRHVVDASLQPRRSDFKPHGLKSSVFIKAWCGSFHTFLQHELGGVYAFGLDNYGNYRFKITRMIQKSSKDNLVLEINQKKEISLIHYL